MDIIREIKENIKMEVRPNSSGIDYLEAVVKAGELELLKSLLTKHLGMEAKEPGKKVDFPPEIQRLIDSIGGLRMEQSFFYRKTGDHTAFYAALWPWASDSGRITLKMGIRSLPNE